MSNSINTILVVDDGPNNLAALRQILAPHYRVVYANNGEEALIATAKHHPALILMDIQMPVMNGYTACRQLKSNPETEHIPVIFITSLDDEAYEELGFDAGAVDFIVKPVTPRTVLARVRTHLSLVHASALEKSYRESIHMLGEAGHYNDTDTGVHIWRMADYAATLAQALGWTEADSQELKLAAPMHDTGKIGIPDSILRKPGKLDPQEWAIMQTHAQIGYDILSQSQAPLMQMAAEIALRHHEKWDGSGYPGGLAGTDIPETARIVALADVFDALTMKRPYKEAWPLDRVLQTINEGANKHFDPYMVEAFNDCMPHILEVKAYWKTREKA